MSGNYRGGQHQLSATFQRITSDQGVAGKYLNIRNLTGNGTVKLSPDGIVESGFVKADDGRQFVDTKPYDIFVKGTAGEMLYWDVT